MSKYSTKDLKIKFIDILLKQEGFVFTEGNPFLIALKGKKYYIFVKNISPAYFVNSPGITRIQLPYIDKFDEIKNSNIPFVVLGFDIKNDTIVCWDPKGLKSRLNSKDNISLYSRQSFQEESCNDEYNLRELSNGDKILLFKSIKLTGLFDELDLFFSNKYTQFDSDNVLLDNNPTKIDSLDYRIVNDVIKLLEHDEFLEAVKLCMQFYRDTNSKMAFKDWVTLIKKYQK